MQAQADLTGEQERQFREIRQRAVAEGRDVSDLILALVESPKDQAAIAEAFAPGAGEGYLS
ncbi:hypothetical protein Ade02nite_20480 [Paractinoplanes deccanensis]|uniref:Uncharacterized protein n=1 Tax=Paractinoplanes deccanensis TaxID=113561 RepID=A0ABQ3Y094_9ACTN|nr:hypothetical protein [Actinoplanes deccanensis]GID73407.1 hypothetical protein Ade02nite_20480 [Actinoplanes deccanensis]